MSAYPPLCSKEILDHLHFICVTHRQEIMLRC
nr:MAG TPA: hypothetical protein [Caudoviricetes sp.]